ncbi:restriction endonuclease subunit S [Anabaena azotica]|uniref:Restriction endonuclease subunit S n=1 Tax=Anabaena azotica FACHB-119 TaxID=947527 RepID=A0ABR8D9G8_9NOST|nr:restriction endonuclease subunit S [Anabaena azotica]MBD2503845.1 restriction endonuclease subunit S [Anabaena azotica FACHB-119]
MLSKPVWQEEKLGKYAYIKGRIGWRGLKASEYTEDGPYLIAGNHITAGQINWSACDHISMRRYLESREIALEEGDIILTKDGTIGRVAIIDKLPGLATINSTMMLIRVRSPLVPRYVYHYLTGDKFQKLVADKVSGSSIPHIFQRDMVELTIPVPSESEQHYIAEILDSIDSAIAHTTSIIAKLKQIKAGLLHDLLTRGLDENGELRNAIAHPEQFKDSPLGLIPKDWEVVKLESVLNGRPKNGYSPKEVDEWTGTLMLGLSCLTEEGFEPCQLKNAPLKDPKVSNAILHDGDFLLSRSNTRERVALAGIYRDIGVPCIYPDLMMRLSLYEKTNPRFLELLLQHFPVRRQLTSNAQGTSGSMVKIGSQTVIGVVIALPDPVEQVSIIHGIDQHDTRIREEEAYLEKLKLHKKGLMHDLLTGKVRVNQINTSASLSVKAEPS